MQMPIAFLRPDYLYLLVPLLLLAAAGFLLKWHLSRRFDEFFQGEASLGSGLSSGRSWTRGALLSCAFTAMGLALGAPSTQSQCRSFNFMALVDITQSMWCEDYREGGIRRSRLDMAKANLLSLLDQLPADARLGLSVFAGTSDSLLVLTPPQVVGKARSDLKSMIESIHYHWTWDDGTSLEEPLYKMSLLLEGQRDQYGKGLCVILLTDGEEQKRLGGREVRLEPQKFRGVSLFLAGYGTVEGAPVPEFDDRWKLRGYRVKEDGSPIISRLDESRLKELARLFHGSYKRVENSSSLKALAWDNEFRSGEYKSNRDVGWVFWLGSFVLLVLSFVV